MVKIMEDPIKNGMILGEKYHHLRNHPYCKTQAMHYNKREIAENHNRFLLFKFDSPQMGPI